MPTTEDERRIAQLSGVESGPDTRPAIWGQPGKDFAEPPKDLKE